MKWSAQRIGLVVFGTLVTGGGVGLGVYLYGSRIAKGYKVAYTFKATKKYEDVAVAKDDLVRFVGKVVDIYDGMVYVQWNDVYNFTNPSKGHFDSTSMERDPIWISKYLGTDSSAPSYFIQDMPDSFEPAVLTKIGMF